MTAARGRRLVGALWVLLAVVLAVAAFAGLCGIGVAVTMGQSFRAEAPVAAWPASRPLPPDRKIVAVVVGRTGSVAADVLAPFEVFARSAAFAVVTVADERKPVALSGGLALLPDRTFAELASGPRPDVVVVPAVVDPTGAEEAAARSFVADQAARGSTVLGVCVGAELAAASGVLDGRRATSFWDAVDGLAEDYPAVDWVRGKRYVEDGPIVTTAGVTSGVVGALRVVERLAGPAEAARIGGDLAYPGWSPTAAVDIPERDLALSDAPYALNVAFPYFRPTIGIGLADGVGEVDVASAVEAYSGTSFAADAVPVALHPTITTRHGLVLFATTDADVDRVVVPGAVTDPGLSRWAADRGLSAEFPHADRAPGEFSLDPLLRDVAATADRATARVTAKFIEYPDAHLDLTGPAWPWRSTSLAGVALALSAGVGSAPLLLRRRSRQAGAVSVPDPSARGRRASRDRRRPRSG
ncbi:DJ-1/PfpI family protein [Actinokineospora iranica]|uniref:DJ-1/PfpI family protein n=1 Tax=Actinokineospora iranica TaxID=1271860 RepID=A0A1G6WIG8_9PSEU|nr:DJ-1/PfpI family protein [Actinokineospora iranica]SDD65611.1 DJ-1/PfpI family protein [Actinokineospora iranica]